MFKFNTEKKPWLSKEQQIPPMFTYYKDNDLGITEEDRAATKPCKCSQFKEYLNTPPKSLSDNNTDIWINNRKFKLIPHSMLDHTRIELDKKKMFKNLGAP